MIDYINFLRKEKQTERRIISNVEEQLKDLDLYETIKYIKRERDNPAYIDIVRELFINKYKSDGQFEILSLYEEIKKLNNSLMMYIPNFPRLDFDVEHMRNEYEENMQTKYELVTSLIEKRDKLVNVYIEMLYISTKYKA